MTNLIFSWDEIETTETGVSGEWGEFRTYDEFAHCVLLEQLGTFIYATDGGSWGGDVVFWTDDEQEADRFESILQSLEIPYEFQIDGFKYSPELKYTFSVA